MFVFENRTYLITVDYYSNFFEVDHLTSTTATAVIKKLKEQFSRYGIPETVFTDNGPQFVCREFREFEREWEFQYSTSSPLHPQSNGKVENSVKTCKLLMKKALLSKGDVLLALLEFRNTPSERDGVSPSQKLFSRRMRARLPTTKELLKPRVVAERAKRKQKENYDVKAHSLSPLEVGELVRVKLPGKQTWLLAKCVKQICPLSYEVMCGERIYRRNRRDLRKTVETFADIRETQLKYQYSGIQKADVRKSVSKFSDESPSNKSPSEERVLRRSTRVKKLPDRYRAG